MDDGKYKSEHDTHWEEFNEDAIRSDEVPFDAVSRTEHDILYHDER